MKKLLLWLLLPLLSGCVTYYYPATAIEDGVYYAEDDPAYINNSYVNYSYGYAGAAYYPWWSMDYFYLGYRPHAGHWYGYGGYGGYGGYVGSGFSFGISYGYSPWYYPYYSYYSPWYHPYNRHGYGHKNRNYSAGGHDRYVGNNRNYRSNRGGEREDGNEDPSGRRSGDPTGSYGASPVRRYVSTGPSGYSGNQGMVIRSRETTKPGRSRLEPVKTEPSTIASPTLPPTSATRSDYRSRRDGGEIRYRSAAKQGRSRTDPVDSRSPSKGAKVVSAPAPAKYRSRQGGGEIRYRSGTKQGTPRTDPVRSSPPSSASSHPSAGSRSRVTASNSSRSRSDFSSSGRRSSGYSSSGRTSGHTSGSHR